MLSVSTLVGLYKERFNPTKVAKSMGMTREELLSYSQQAAVHGTLKHALLRKEALPTFLPEGNPLHEVRVASEEAGVWGRIDLLIEKEDGTYGVYDWKTCDVIRRTHKRNMRAPVAHLPDCGFTHYSLQLSLYALLWGKPVTTLGLVQVPRSGGETVLVPSLDLRKEASLLLRLQARKRVKTQ